MPMLNVHIKHAGKVYDLPLNTDVPATVFKESVYQVTGVPVERMKVMIKGGVLKVCIVYLHFEDLMNELGCCNRATQTGRRSHRKRCVLLNYTFRAFMDIYCQT